MKFNAVALFCEDIRDETSGVNSLIGVLPDNLMLTAGVPGTQTFLPKLGIYCRTHIPVDEQPEPMTIVLATAGHEQVLSELDESFVAKAIAEAIGNGSPHAGLITKLVSTPFPVPETTQLVLIVKTRDSTVKAAALNLKVLAPTA